MSYWKGKNAFVTGADGFIGSWVAKTLVDQGANVTALVRDMKKQNNLDVMGIKGNLNVVQGDLVDYSVLERIANEFETEAVFHIAAQAIVGVANRSPLSTFESNIKGTWNILEAARNSKTVKKVIVASSDKAYGVQEKLPYTEESPLLGRYPYDASKACADILAQSYFTTYSLPVCITRNANTYGGGDMNFNRIIPGTIQSVLKNEIPIIRSDGTPERDYIYVKDIADAYLLLAEKMDKKGIPGEAFNFGTETPVKVIDLFNKIIELSGAKGVKPKVLGEAKNEIDRQWLSSKKAGNLLGWKPKYSLENGLKETIEWYRNHLK